MPVFRGTAIEDDVQLVAHSKAGPCCRDFVFRQTLDESGGAITPNHFPGRYAASAVPRRTRAVQSGLSQPRTRFYV